MKATIKLLPYFFAQSGDREVIYKTPEGKLIATEIKPHETEEIFVTKLRLEATGNKDIPMKEIKALVAEVTSIRNGYKNQPKDVIGFIAEKVTAYYYFDSYDKQYILENDLVNKLIDIQVKKGKQAELIFE